MSHEQDSYASIFGQSEGARSKQSYDHLWILLTAFTVRALGVVFTVLTTKNTYSLYDADVFAREAQKSAIGLVNGDILLSSVRHVIEVWSLMLAPFWLLPGPSRIYAQFTMALLGSIAVYNIYIVVRHFHSKQAAAVAALPLLFYPSIVLVHSTILREAVVLFGLTTVARLLLVPPPRLSGAVRYIAIISTLTAVSILRLDNIPVYLLVLAVGLTVKHRDALRNGVVKAGVILSVITVTAASLPFIERVLSKIAEIRRARARGRTEYLGHVFPDTIFESVAFSWIGVAYFLFTPFPWMVRSVPDFLVMFEGLFNLLFVAFAAFGAKRLSKSTFPGTMALIVGIVTGSVLYGLGTANVGTAVRHRPMVLWAIFLLGGIGIAEHIRIEVSGKNE